MKEYAHYSNYPKSKWRWKNFKPIEMRSKSDNKLAINEEAMDKLQALRTLIDKPMRITSAYRSPAHNKKVKGAKHSKHLRAEAFDVQMEGHDPAQFEAAAREVGFLGFGFYEKSNFIHVDIGPAREWGVRWFDRADRFGPRPDMAQGPEDDVKAKSGGKLLIAGSAGLVAALYALRDKVEGFFASIEAFIGGLF